MDVTAVIGPLFAVWAIFTFILLFQRRIEWHLRIAAALICAFYCILFFTEVKSSLSMFGPHFRASVTQFLKATFAWTGTLLVVFWPLVILVSFYAAHATLARGLLRIFIVLSLLYWLISFGSGRLGLTVEHVTKFLPDHIDAATLPDIKAPDLKLPDWKVPGVSGPGQNK